MKQTVPPWLFSTLGIFPYFARRSRATCAVDHVKPLLRRRVQFGGGGVRSQVTLFFSQRALSQGRSAQIIESLVHRGQPSDHRAIFLLSISASLLWESTRTRSRRSQRLLAVFVLELCQEVTLRRSACVDGFLPLKDRRPQFGITSLANVVDIRLAIRRTLNLAFSQVKLGL